MSFIVTKHQSPAFKEDSSCLILGFCEEFSGLFRNRTACLNRLLMSDFKLLISFGLSFNDLVGLFLRYSKGSSSLVRFTSSFLAKFFFILVKLCFCEIFGSLSRHKLKFFLEIIFVRSKRLSFHIIKDLVCSSNFRRSHAFINEFIC
ncbi:unnamed protein product [Moneuplotes crassus]|uniref:Uncharacterized protein n=1 Tax=Euplotes crassus TaxID=5936 RepID=A0AAD1Y4X9_EUPCR|nr:unnamed protein product [Moneuplotes crassus]